MTEFPTFARSSLVEIAKVLELDFVGSSYILVLNVRTFLLYVWDFFFFIIVFSFLGFCLPVLLPN